MPYNASGQAARPVAAVVAAARERGVWFFAHFNRIHVLPPLVTSIEDIRHGIAVLDEALALADAEVSGCYEPGARRLATPRCPTADDTRCATVSAQTFLGPGRYAPLA